jgi:hypothetical protein
VANYWSGSAFAENPAQMWGVSFQNGGAAGVSKSFEPRIIYGVCVAA